MTRTMYDGINSDAAAIHQAFPNAAMVAGYDNGRFAWSPADWNLFPNAVKVHISITASANTGDVLDVEAGDAVPGQAAGWIEMRKRNGLYRPTVYCSRDLIPNIRLTTGSLVLGKDYDIWCADYTGQPHQVTAPGMPAAACAATQYENSANWDTSAVYDDGWPHRTPVPPTASHDTWPASTVLREGSTGGAVRVLQTALRDSGIPGVRGITVDGIFGGQTLAAVRNYQAYKGLAVDGIAGPKTRAALGV